MKRLKDLARATSKARHPNVPDYARTIHAYTETTANGLTRCIVDWLVFSGWQAERVQVQGRLIDNTKMVENVMGHQRRVGSNKWIPSSMQPGTADISATINGRSVKIEVKIGRDAQSAAQLRYQKQVERALGIYFVARSWAQFIQWYDELIQF